MEEVASDEWREDGGIGVRRPGRRIGPEPIRFTRTVLRASTRSMTPSCGVYFMRVGCV